MADLHAFIHQHTGVAPENQSLLVGFPPRPIANATSLAAAGIKAGDTVVVKNVPATPKADIPAPMHVTLDGDAILALKVVPDDNSCLFNAISHVSGSDVSQQSAAVLRQTAAQIIESDPHAFPDAVLGEPRSSYVAKLLKPTTWGGALELAVFSQYFGVEIWCWDVQSGVCHRFGEGNGYATCWMLVYSGIHYDALEARPSTSSAQVNTIFSTAQDDTLEKAATELIALLRAKH
ncbi:ubiquitin-specific protease otu1 [Malassezia cuniculi]|uniref:Ubiquitin thioesterase OTU n=1 Tax=Malassezia cuniculi TaxID=948313 RepID=A0AAF0J7E0_9BASI|nr:ubiquitin-specific protease otu1 [Malassezia cuniculi]